MNGRSEECCEEAVSTYFGSVAAQRYIASWTAVIIIDAKLINHTATYVSKV